MRYVSRPSRARAALLGLLLVAVLGACSTATVAQPAATPSSPVTSAEPTESTETAGTLLTTTDEQLSDLATEIEQDRDVDDIPGYAGVAVDGEHAALDLWWVGEPPERIRRLIAAPPHGLVIRLHAAAYDYAATDRAVAHLMDRYPVIHAASPETDGSGIEVETTAKGKRSLPSAARLAAQVGMPVRVVISEPPQPA